MPHQPASSALVRFPVIEMTRVRVGPIAARQLADWGADVNPDRRLPDGGRQHQHRGVRRQDRERFREAMGAPEWVDDERSRTKAVRSVNRAWLNAGIEQRLRENTSDYWVGKLNAAGVACARINNVRGTFEKPRVRHLGMLRKVTSKRLGEQVLMGIHDFGKPTLAAIRGCCIGAGVNVAISCDALLASVDSTAAAVPR